MGLGTRTVSQTLPCLRVTGEPVQKQIPTQKVKGGAWDSAF